MPKHKEKSPSVESIERLLRRARKEQGLSIEDVVRDTRVRKMHLKQFETKLPESLDVYQLGYLRLYAKYLGVDIQKYIGRLSQSSSHSEQPRADTNISKQTNPIKYAKTKNIIAALLIITLIISGILIVKKRRLHSNQGTPTTQQPVAEIKSDAIVTLDPISLKPIDNHTYSLNGTLEQLAKIKIIAKENTSFTVMLAENNFVIAKGKLKAGEELILPKDDNIANKQLTIKTNIAEALTLQQTE